MHVRRRFEGTRTIPGLDSMHGRPQGRLAAKLPRSEPETEGDDGERDRDYEAACVPGVARAARAGPASPHHEPDQEGTGRRVQREAAGPVQQGAADRRYRSACESLARIRKLACTTPALQVNIAAHGGQQVNIAAEPTDD